MESAVQVHRWRVIAAVMLLAAVGTTFAPVIHGGFIGLDDGNNIFLNPQLGGWSWDRVVWAFSDFGRARRYMPLGWLGFSAVFSWQGLAPAGYHLASLAWHLLAAVALFAATRNILRRSPAALAAGEGWNIGAAFLVAAAWALHPMRTEAVAWASGLLYTQASAFAFLALWFWTLRWSAPAKAAGYSIASCLALAASLLTYPIALGLPVVCWLLDLLAEKDPALPAAGSFFRRWRISPAALGLVAVAALVLAATLSARGENSGTFATGASLGSFGITERLLQAFYVWGRYLRQLVWPAGLSPVYTDLYSLEPLGRGVFLTVVVSGLLLMLYGLWAWRRRISAGWVLAYTAMALPFLGLLEHPWIAHDRYAMLLHPVWLVAGAWWLLRVKSHRLRSGIAAALLLVGLSGASGAHSLIANWKDQAAVDARLRQTLPHDAWAGYYLGNVPASVLFLEGRFAEIGPLLAQAQAESPGWSAAPTRAEFDALIRQHQEFLRQNWPGRSLAPVAVLHYLHGQAAAGRRDWVTARAHFQAARRVAPDLMEAQQAEAQCERELRH
ncbi:MAG: hypothetical protein JWQ83_785 [Lacunisphaera sp.]|nr:hypothetical protein [Lacunisphaera sp.]